MVTKNVRSAGIAANKKKINAPKTAASKKALAKKPAVRVATAPYVNPHVDAGMTTTQYTGMSKALNAKRPVKIMQGVTRAAGQLTSRMQGSLYDLRRTYAKKPFVASGYDNGVLSALAASGLITLSGGQKQTLNGKNYLIDGAKQVVCTLTAAGMSYGKA